MGKSTKISSSVSASTSAMSPKPGKNCVVIFQRPNFKGANKQLCNRKRIGYLGGSYAKFANRIRSVKLGSNVKSFKMYSKSNHRGSKRVITKTKENISNGNVRSLSFSTKSGRKVHGAPSKPKPKRAAVPNSKNPGENCVVIFQKKDYKGGYLQMCGTKIVTQFTGKYSKFSNSLRSIKFGKNVKSFKMFKHRKHRGTKTVIRKSNPNIKKGNKVLSFYFFVKK